MNKIKIILIVCLIIYLLTAFGTEILYRNKLYEISVDYIEKIKQEGFFHYFYYFWSVIFLLAMMIIGITITLVFYPINIFFSYLSLQIILVFIMCLLKSLYSNPRPMWDIYLENQKNRTDIFLPTPTECDGGFGNPSGHALSSTYILSLWDLFINSHYFRKIEGKKKLFVKYFTLILSLTCIIFIIYSRINRQIHSFNQIIFGTILGFAVIFTFCYILDINKKDTNIFMEALNSYKFILIPIFIILFATSVILGLLRHNNNEEKYLFILENYCHYTKEQLFGKNTTLFSSIILLFIGSYAGLLFLRYKIKKKNLNNEKVFYNWNKYNKKQICKIISISFIFPSIFIIPIFLISYKYYIIKFIISSICLLIYGFLSFGPCFYFSCLVFKKSEFVEDELLINNNENEEENNI